MIFSNISKTDYLLITSREWRYILENKGKKDFFMKVNFGLRKVRVKIIEDKKVVLDDKFHLNLRLKIKENFCYLVKKRKVYPCAFFSSDTNRFYKLAPTDDWPTVMVSSTPMHKLSSPYKDALAKIKLLKPYGVVLDTCMGLGYTAILASQKAERVITFEIDKNIAQLAKINPVSRPLFNNPKIKIYFKDISEYIKKFPQDTFDTIIHDPPTFKLAPSLYSEDFYQELFYVLKKGGRLYHYLPLWGIKRGRFFPQKIKEKIKRAGFKIKIYLPEEGHLICVK